MTHSVAATSAAATPAETARAHASRAGGASFAEVHTAAVRDAEGAPKGERTQPVPGHSYVEIVSGPRNGMFINNTGNRRDGEAFLIVKRHGREFHIYGTGEDRAVYEVGRKRESAPAAGSTGSDAAGTTGTSTPAPSGTTATT
jgi:hypothetical protein